MGGSVSAGRTNDELVDHLVETEFIKTPLIQQVLRAVDRGNYYIPDQKHNAYKDIAWKMGRHHLSAPCVYSVVLEALTLRAGLSFLNLGSGSGYLSTVVGLILGPYGVNHGVELYSEMVDFAYERLEEFMKNAKAIDEFDFCEPSFLVGNCLELGNTFKQYDRVYCGASCPEEYEPYLKNLIKVGGILVMPLKEKLLKITRTSETRWHTSKLFSVSFTSLVPSESSKASTTKETVMLGDISPPKLQHLCRSKIRTILKGHVDSEHPDLKVRHQKQERRCRRIVIPFYEESDFNDSNSDSSIDSDLDSDEAPIEYAIRSALPSRMSWFIEDFLRRHAELQLFGDVEDQISNSESDTETSGPSVSFPQLFTTEDSAKSNFAESEPEWISSNDFFSIFTRPSATPSASSDESARFMKTPSQSTRSQTKKLLQKRKRPDDDAGKVGTSSENCGEPSKKAKRTVDWEKRIEEERTRRRLKKEREEAENYSVFIVEKIGALPLPSLLLRYLNYRRDSL